jgi:hypothetical protein
VEAGLRLAPPEQGLVTPKHSAHLTLLLDAVRDLIRSYVVISNAQADAIALWTVHTHVIDAFDATPFLAVTSPEKRCGKTRLLDVLELIAARPWRTIMPSDAVLYRKIDADAPTLMLDETDAIFNSRNPNTEPLRALLNAGNQRGTVVPRCAGPKQELREFQVFGPKVLAGIGALPDTIGDRSIPIRLARKRADEQVERFRRRTARELAEPLHQELASWAQDAVEELAAARPEVPEVLDDRAEEAWEPLLAIADLAGGNWPERARLAALKLSAPTGRDDDALGVKLLSDIRGVFQVQGVDRIPSAALAAALAELEESPWGDIRGKQLDARGLARRLKPFDVRPRTIRLGDETPKGYQLEQFADAFARYLSSPATPASTDHSRHTATTLTSTGIANNRDLSEPEAVGRAKDAWGNACGGVAASPSRNGDGDAAAPSAWWECPCGREEREPGKATPAGTIVSLREPHCPWCSRQYCDDYRWGGDTDPRVPAPPRPDRRSHSGQTRLPFATGE